MGQTLPFSAGALLEAIEGIAYIVAGDGTILGFSRGPFMPFDRGLTPWQPPSAIGRNLFDMMHGEEVASAYRVLHEAVWSGGLTTYGFEYRCDAPEVERHMRMSLSRVQEDGRPLAVLYQSVILHETRRAPIPLFGENVLSALRADPTRPSVILCSYCHAVAWPAGAAAEGREWVEPHEYYRRGGATEVQVSHGICPPCYARIVEPALEALRKGHQPEVTPPFAAGAAVP